VNTASRMESSDLPGRIQLSEQAAALFDGDFVIEERGTVEIKGKGSMKTYWLLGRHQAEGGDFNMTLSAKTEFMAHIFWTRKL